MHKRIIVRLIDSKEESLLAALLDRTLTFSSIHSNPRIASALKNQCQSNPDAPKIFIWSHSTRTPRTYCRLWAPCRSPAVHAGSPQCYWESLCWRTRALSAETAPCPACKGWSGSSGPGSRRLETKKKKNCGCSCKDSFHFHETFNTPKERYG